MGAPGDLVWARWAAGSSSDVAFALCRIGNEGLLADAVELVPVDARLPRRAVAYHDVFPAGDHTKDVDDNCELMFLNEATLLNNILNRYHKDKIYTFVANILIAVNPYKDIRDLYATPTIRSYQGKSLGEKAPHVFALADKAFRDMRNLKQSQSIIVSGESGAGKTESTKYILKYLCDLWAAGAGPVEQKILDANPILEAFGNAKTTRNNNSSRFGKFMEVHFSNKWQVVGGHISHYLLEKSRICTQSPEERNYHVFYLLCAGAPAELRQKLRLTKPDDFNYLRSGCTQYFTSATTNKRLTPSQCSKSHTSRGPLRDPLLDDVEDFQRLHQALSRTGLSDAESYAIYCTVGAVLHLGNIDFEDDPDDAKGGCRVKSSSESCLSFTAQLLGVDHSELRMSLISRLMQSSRGGLKGTAIMVPLKTREAANARDALAKALYSRLFDHIVSVINTSIPLQASSYYIGVLDIAGFEYFTVNSYEQFCINYCNEKLQQFFNERILKNEQELYRREGLLIPEITYVDNQDCIELIESKNGGIFNLLDEESKLPRPDCGNFTLAVHKRWGKENQGSRVTVPRASRLKAHRSLRDDDGFLLRHFAGAVCYNTSQFIEKNNDALHASLEFLVQESANGLVRGLFSSARDNNNTKGKLTFISVGSKFQTQLAQLMDKLKQNGTNFVRCIKPNSKMIDSAIEPSLVLTQLECSGTIAVLELMEHGYPSRAPFNDLYNMYKSYLPPKLSKLSPKTFCEGVLGALGLHSRDYRFGVSRVFFRPGKYSEFDTLMRSDPENLRTLVARLERWLVRSRWRKAIFGVICIVKLKNKILFRRHSLIIIQKTIRSYLVRKQHKPRYRGIVKIRALEENIKQMETATQQLKKDKDKAQKKIKELRDDITAACKQIKGDPKIMSVAIDNLYNRLVSKVENEMALLQKSMQDQKNREEQERLRKIQEEMRAMEEAKRREEQRIREEEERRKQKSEMEARRKVEEAERLRREEQDRLAAIKLQQQLEQDQLNDQENMKRLEQERRDHEMALRLATESGGLVEGSPPQLRSFASLDGSISGDNRLIRSEKVRAQQAVQEKQKFDLSKWKYSELRDTINTSCDIELLEACRHEFHRRLKVYHAWKAKNQRKTTNMSETERAPRSVMDAAAKAPRIQQRSDILGARHRYFRIPFMRPGAGVAGGDKKGWWYAHFDGQYVARQMELHPDKSPVLLLSGVDDMQMCELSLEETGLTRKRGAEILEHEFSREWLRNGGPPYIPPEQRKA